MGLVTTADAASSQLPTFTNGYLEAGYAGWGQHLSGTQYVTLPINRSRITNQVTYFLLCDTYAPLTSNSFLFADCDPSGATYNSGLYSNGSSYSMFIHNGAGNSTSSTTGSNVARNGLSLCGTYGGSANGIKIYVNGTLENTNAGVSGNISTNAGSLSVNRWNSSTGHGVRPYVGLVWNRELSAGEVASITANPWQVFVGAGLPYTITASSGTIGFPLFYFSA